MTEPQEICRGSGVLATTFPSFYRHSGLPCGSCRQVVRVLSDGHYDQHPPQGAPRGPFSPCSDHAETGAYADLLNTVKEEKGDD